jgi:hypothetical protein
MKRITLLFLVLLCLLKGSLLSGQENTATSAVTGFKPVTGSGTSVWFQTDRGWYLPGEPILFKAFILDGLNNRTFQVKDTLHLIILDQFGLAIASTSMPVENNIISGNIDLPDILTDGNYILVSWLSSMKKLPPEVYYSRIIEVRKSPGSLLVTNLSLDDSVYESGSQMTLQLKFTDNENNPVPAGFSYQLLGRNEEIISGNNKASSEGNSILKLQLPKFDGKETLELIINPSYKGLRSIIGIIIPTHFNLVQKLPETKLTSSEFKTLNIQIKPGSLIFGKGDKVELNINVSDENGTPAMANLSVSASNIVPVHYPIENENLLTFSGSRRNQNISVPNTGINEFFTQSLNEKTQTPGHPFIIQEKNNAKKIKRKLNPANQKNINGYSSDRSIFDILMSIKPYHLDNGKITFGLNSMNSINSQDGALIIVDGIKMGTDASVLNTISVPDIARITASTNVMDIQRYSAMNNVGIIEITTKKNKAFIKSEENAADTKSNTLFWGPEILTDSAGRATVSFTNNGNTHEVLVTVEAISANGAYGSNSIRYSVK